MIERWLEYLRDPKGGSEPMEVIRFQSQADFDPVRGEDWGVLVSKAGRAYPFCGSLVLFERTEEAEPVFARVERELTGMRLSNGFRFPAPVRVGHGHTADGLFSTEQVSEYDKFLVDSPFWTALRDITFEDWERHIPKQAVILDLGCGTGRCIQYFSQRSHPMIGLDLSYSMLVSLLRSSDFNRNDTLLVLASAVSLPFRNSCVPSITCFGTLHHVASPAEALHEASRVLADRGVFQALEPNKSPVRFVFDFAMKVLPMWQEEAGEENLFSVRSIHNWSADLPFNWHFRYSIFILPQLAAIVPSRRAMRFFIRGGDWLGRVPVVRGCAGLLIFRGRKK